MIILGGNGYFIAPAGFGVNIVDWGRTPRGTVVTPSVGTGNWTLGYQLLFVGAYFDWSGNGQFSGAGNVYGTSGGASSGPLQLIMSGISQTVGTVQSYNDGIISVVSFGVNDPQPVKAACIGILKQVGKTGRVYSIDVFQNGVKQFNVNSVYWGTQQTWSDQYTNDQLVHITHALQPNLGQAS